jgi:F-type H+-transporting ATPase subunit delta
MKHSRAAIRYAKAVLDIASENKAVDAVEADMQNILRVLSENTQLQEVISSPVIEGTVKKNALNAIFKDQHAISKGFISLLVDNKRIVLLNEVALKFIILNKELKGQDLATITTAVPLTPEIAKRALEQLSKITDRKVTLEKNVDPAILGGFVLRMGDIQYDASLASKLNTIKREFIKSL